MNREELIESLLALGFKVYKPRARSYHVALVSQNKTETIYFLLRRYGVDFIYYKHLRKLELDDKNLLYTDATNGFRVRNTYDGTKFNIHDYIVELARIFNSDQTLQNIWLEDNGYTRFEKNKIFLERIGKGQKYDLVEIFRDIEPDNSGYKYIADGMWLTPDGELTDEEPIF